MTLSKAEYEAYLQSDHWKAIRKTVLEQAEHRCQLCYSPKKLQVHHRTYERLSNERASDLIALCRRCHIHFHGIDGGPTRHLSIPTKRKKTRKAKKHKSGKSWNTPRHRRPSSRMTIRYAPGGDEMQEAVEHLLDIANPRTDATDVARRGIDNGQRENNHAEQVG